MDFRLADLPPLNKEETSWVGGAWRYKNKTRVTSRDAADAVLGKKKKKNYPGYEQ